MWMNTLVFTIAAEYHIIQGYSKLCVKMYTSACWVSYNISAGISSG